MESTIGGGSSFLDGEWESLCGLFTTEQDTDFPSSFFFSHNHHHHQDDFNLLQYGGADASAYNVLQTGDHFTPPSSNHLSQASSSSVDTTASKATTPIDLGCCFQTDQFNSLQPFMDFLSMDTHKDDDEGLFFTFPPVSNQGFSATNQAAPIAEVAGSTNHLMIHNADEFELVQPQQTNPTPKKRSRVSKYGEKGKRKVRARKNKQPVTTTEEEDQPGRIESNTNGQTSSCTDMMISDNESNAAAAALEEGNEGSETAKGKKRASRGAATDPQSLYARKRRERINERLRILQNLVPNGTKVDISTMLEEAVHYVKFLQLQIKLLSSDDTWMYAPLAYSGFDISLYTSFSPFMMKPQGF